MRKTDSVVSTKFQKKLGELVKKSRKEKDITQIDLAIAVGITQPVISLLEKGELHYEIPLDLVLKLASVLKFSIDKFIKENKKYLVEADSDLTITLSDSIQIAERLGVSLDQLMEDAAYEERTTA